MNANAASPPMAGGCARLSAGHLVVAMYGAVILALAVHFVFYLRYAIAAVQYPFALDYGEGIVWQQAVLIPGDRMYGDITRFPFIVFHYPPLYHLAVRAVAALEGDALLAGRCISLICTLLIGCLVAALSYEIGGRKFGRAAGLIGSAIAGLTVFCYWPVVAWSPLMRVDMLAIMLCLVGVWLAMRSIRHPWLLILAVLAFVLAVYTKQTSVSAPLAVMLVFLVTDRRRALRAYGLGLVLGLAGLLVLTWATDGGFLRHVLVYNLNRFSFRSAASSILEESSQTVFLVASIGGLVAGWRGLVGQPDGKRPALFGRCLSQNPATRPMAILTLYLIIATGMLATLGKSGAILNYLIEWMCLWSVLIGILVASALGPIFAEESRTGTTASTGMRLLSASIVPITLLAQIFIMPTARDYHGGDMERETQLAALTARIRDARQPVLSDDMVLLMKAGKEIPWEPAIFAELASTGRWDQRLILDKIATRSFAFIVTQGHAGERTYDDRFTPGVDQAIRQAYPRTEEQGGRTLHLPPVRP
jgi:hypothetical protein